MGVKFFLSFDPIHNHLMVSLPAEKIILRVNLDFWPVKVDILAGQNGRSCRGNGVCGDEGLAKEATLSYPKVNRPICLLKFPFRGCVAKCLSKLRRVCIFLAVLYMILSVYAIQFLAFGHFQGFVLK